MKAGGMLAFNSTTGQYLRLLDALDQAAIATNADGVVADWNRSAEDLYGWRREDAIGRNIVDLTPARLMRDEAASIMTSLADGQIWSGEFPVRTRGGDTFRASVTDVPIVDEFDNVVGVVGVSAPARGPASLSSTLIRFGAACETLWPGLVDLTFADLNASVPASEPHVLQLLSLLIMRYAEALENGATVDVAVRPASGSVFADFGVRTTGPTAYIRFAVRNGRRSWSLLRDEISAARETNYAAKLVRLIGGWLFVESAGNGTQVTHLLLPVSP